MLIIHNTSQVVPLTAKAQRGRVLGTLNIIENGAVAIDGGKIADLGKGDDLFAKYPGAEKLDAHGNALLPGFVDPHTHLIWAGDRAAEFEMRSCIRNYQKRFDDT